MIKTKRYDKKEMQSTGQTQDEGISLASGIPSEICIAQAAERMYYIYQTLCDCQEALEGSQHKEHVS